MYRTRAEMIYKLGRIRVFHFEYGRYNQTKIIDCYDVGRIDEYLVDIAQNYNNVIGTAGEKSL